VLFVVLFAYLEGLDGLSVGGGGGVGVGGAGGRRWRDGGGGGGRWEGPGAHALPPVKLAQHLRMLSFELPPPILRLPHLLKRVAVISAKKHKRHRRKRQSVTAKREKSQTPTFITAIQT